MSIGASPFMSNFPGGFANGISLRGIPLAQTHPGKVFWLSNSSVVAPGGNAGADGNPGTFQNPMATLAGVLGKVTAGRGDIIFVKPGHAENISSATALNMSASGVAVIGLGMGFLRPTFTLDTANTSTITVSANDVSFQNCIFVANFLNIASLFTLTTAKGFVLDNCQVKDTSSILNFLAVITTSATSNANDYLTVTRNNVFLQATSGACPFVSILGSHNFISITDNSFQAATTNAGAFFPIATTKVVQNLQLLRNLLQGVNAAATATGIVITTDQTTHTGYIHDNTMFTLANTTLASSLLVTAGSGIRFGTNRYCRAADKSAVTSLPALDT
jgi:hypothetical protein